MGADNSPWTDDELRDAVFAYKTMQRELDAGRPVVKRAVYKALSERWGRTESSYERRMGNISAVLDLYGRSWIKGLKPLSNVGTNVIAVINRCLNEFDGFTDISDAVFDIEVAKKVKIGSLEPPAGSREPSSKKVEVMLLERDADVKAWVLVNSKGICECCDAGAPFISSTGIPYLEVHHVKRLADKGPDTIENAVALCPNCHKALHFSHDKSQLVEALYKKIGRLKS